MKLVLASANAHKLSEIKALLPQGFEALGLKDIGLTTEIPEPGETITENSFLKASYVQNFLLEQNVDYAILADDSGLEVKALNGAPGVHSAYYAGLPKNDPNNNQKLLSQLYNQHNRKARFVTVLTLLWQNNKMVFEGEVQGTIAFEGRGNNGFGYDPLFVPTGYRSTFAQLSAEEKNKISHRAKAMEQFVKFIAEGNLE
jgi:XTP/dITP diphosphohydrolase